MARIDRVLSIVADQGANELRVGTDREPKMLAYGAVKRLSIPMTTEETLRDLLGEMLTPEREEALGTRGRVELAYEAADVGTFQVTMTRRADGFDVVFVRSSTRVPVGRSAAEKVSSEWPVNAVPAPSAPFMAVAPAVAPPVTLASLPASGGEAVAARADLGYGDQVEQPSPALASLVAHAAERRASDLHLADGDAPVLRIDGKLQRLDVAPIDVASFLALGPGAERRLAHASSIDLGMEIAGVARLRVHVFRTSTGRAASIRLLPRTAPSLASLNLPLSIEDLVDLPHGLVLVCGATGSGKSTTLAALAQDALRRRSAVLTTLEDPIEYALVASETSVVHRRQVGRDAPDFASGLRDALRQDPDLILIGEMRDPETISLALTAAETGHLVLASLHSRSAVSAVERIIDAYPPERALQVRVQLADSLRAVIAQRLLPRARGTGRVVALEVMRSTHAIASLIRDGKTAQIGSFLQSGRREGMITLERCLADRVLAGEIRAEDARAAANDPSALATYLAK
jgi:twitching motility protein PilT